MTETDFDGGLADGDHEPASEASAAPAGTLTDPAIRPEDPPTRTAGLARLATFVPRAADYARGRNLAIPPYTAVSRLSPFIRHRLVLEQEVVAAVWAAHSRATVDKYVSEVLWRAYWKGWLALRPQVWPRYLEQASADLVGLSAVTADRYAAACAGRTGIDCFDAWVGELTTTGYLHNHARLWFASIWIFTLGLPWTLGAVLFLRHLLDGDPASNTLSWRWVAGLHTQGKHYLARAENIARFTGGRFDPRGLLNEDAPAQTEDATGLDPRPIAPLPGPDPDAPSGLLLTPEDLTAEHSALVMQPLVGVAAGWDQEIGRRLDLSPKVVAFARGALVDGLARAEQHFQVPARPLDAADWQGAAEDWARGLGVRQILTLEAPVGPWRERLEQLGDRLAGYDIRLAYQRRAWDAVLWPMATKGFFPFREHALQAGRLAALVAPEERIQ